MANVGPLAAEIGSFGSLRHPSKFQRVSRLGFVTAATSLVGGQPNFPPSLAVSWGGITFWGALAPNGILSDAKFTLRPSFAFSYIGKRMKCDKENFICNQYGERLATLNTENIKICGRITKLEAIKNAFFCVFFNICRKLGFLTSKGSVAICLS